MRILIDIGHPAHVHYFKNIAKHFILKNGSVLFTTRDKDVTISLLKAYNFNFINFGQNYKSIIGKIFGTFIFSIKFFFVALRSKPDVILNASPYSAFTAYILRIPHISIEDTFNMEQVRIYLPFTSVVLIANYNHPSLGKKEIQYSGYQELLYLHPNNFIPDEKIYKFLGIEPETKFVILRFIAWHSSHDYGHKGISFKNKIKAVKEFSKYAKVFISSEKELPKQLIHYRIQIPPEKMHDAIAFASLIFGESATMVSEGAVLGVPGIYLDNTGRLYTKEEEEKYGLVFNYSESEEDQKMAIKKGIELLSKNNIKDEWFKKKEKLLDDKIDVTAFIIWFIENYPDSVKIMKENPDYQYRFK